MISILAIIAIYKMNVGCSPALRSLLQVQDEVSHLFKIKLLVIDNSVDDAPQRDIPQGVEYIKNNINSLSAAYNIAARMAAAKGFDYVLTIDQDTEVTIEYFTCLHNAIRAGMPDDVASIVPQLVSRGIKVSPTREAAWPDLDAHSTEGVATEEIAAFNSLNCIRTEYLIKHPYDERFTVDMVDNSFFAELYGSGHRAYVLPISLEHGFSLASGVMPIGRYKGYLRAYTQLNAQLPLHRRLKNRWRLFRRIFEHLHHHRPAHAAAAAVEFLHAK